MTRKEQQDWFKRHADRSNPKAFIHTNPTYFASECASAINNGSLVVVEDMDWSLRDVIREG